MAFGRNSNSTILVQLGDTRPFSDVGGRHVLYLSNSPTTRQEFATKLANAGCNVDTSGADWLTAGEVPLRRTEEAPKASQPSTVAFEPPWRDPAWLLHNPFRRAETTQEESQGLAR